MSLIVADNAALPTFVELSADLRRLARSTTERATILHVDPSLVVVPATHMLELTKDQLSRLAKAPYLKTCPDIGFLQTPGILTAVELVGTKKEGLEPFLRAKVKGAAEDTDDASRLSINYNGHVRTNK
jgi:hypothetical protein